MREASTPARDLLTSGRGGFRRQVVADLIYDDERRLQDLKILTPRLRWDGTAQVAGSADCTVVVADPFGRSMMPSQIGDMFSPFGAELQIDMIITAGRLVERIPMGRFIVDGVAGATHRQMDRAVGGLPVTTGERIPLRLRDTLARVQRDRFAFPTSPTTASMWGEVQALTGMPVIRNTNDATIPLTITHNDNKLNALDELLALVDAVPHLTATGALTSRPKTWPSAIDEFRGVASAPLVMEADETFNRVVVEGKSPAGVAIYGIAEISTGYLRVWNSDGSRSPFGAATHTYRSDVLTTVSQCKALAASMLPRMSKLRSVTREVVEPLNPLREIGDVVLLEGGETRIQSIEHDSSTTRSVVEVAA
ncbi:hypothetical protein [Microbacterium sp.]|uniref:hypothetical protein n=1 Tax=Microbacterium sp. TaxID=51671 RepID=UPI003F715A15